MLVKLSDIATYKQGKQVDISQQFQEPFHKSIRFIRIIDYTNSNEPIRYVQDFGKQYHVNSKDLVMIRYGSQTAGRVVRGIEGLIANNMFKICFNKQVNIDYIYYYLSRDIIFNQLRSNQSSSTMPAITFEMMNSLIINFPNEKQQCHIVDTIGSIDDFIEGKQKENDNINLLIQSLFKKHTNSVEKIRIGDLDGYVIIKSGIKDFKGNKVYLDTASVDKNGISSRDYIITNDNKPSRANMQPIAKSIWFAKLKDSPKFLFVQEYMDDILNNYIFSTGFLGLEANTRFIANYLYALITSGDFDAQKNALSIGATMQGINNDSFKEIMVPSLSIDQMSSIGEKLDSLLAQIYANNRKIQNLNNLKQLYLKKFFG